MQAPKIFFLHNPKGGGSSLRSLLGRQFASDAIAPVFDNDPSDHRADTSALDRYPGYSLYAGHYGYEAFRKLEDGHQVITNFRAPAARIVSLYRYWRNNVGPVVLAGLDPDAAAVVMLSKTLSFAEFIRSDNADLQLYISNFHFRQLLHSGWENTTIRPWTMPLVKRRIGRMPWFYVAEMPYESQLLLRQAFPSIEGDIPSENRSEGEKIAVDDSDVRHVMRLNPLDYELFHYAVRLQCERVLINSSGV